MAAEPTDPTLVVSPSRGPWAPGWDPWSQSNNRTGNSTSGADGDQTFFHLDNIISLLTVLVCLCGAAGNGAVVWLLRLRRKRRRFSVYIRTLAWVDGTFLLLNGILYICLLLQLELEVWGNLWLLFQLTRLGLLVAVSTKHFISVPGPLWHRWSCLDRFSSVVGLLICALAVCLWLSELVCEKVDGPCDGLDWAYVVTGVVTFLVVCVSSLMLLMWVQCSSWGTRPRRLHVAILLTVLAFLLLGLPYNVYVLVLTIAPDTVYVPGLWETLVLLSTINSAVNPIIYFLVGRYRRGSNKMPLGEGLQRPLSDNNEGLSSGAPSSPDRAQVCGLLAGCARNAKPVRIVLSEGSKDPRKKTVSP